MRTIRLGIGVVIGAIVSIYALPLVAAGQPDDETLAWAAIMDSQSATEIRTFMGAFPNGKFTKDARLKYSLLAQTSLPPQVQELHLVYPNTARGDAFRSRRVVILDVLVGPDGKAETVTYTRHSGVDVMDYAANGAAKRATYLPAVENGVAVKAHLSLPVEFGQVCSAAASGVSECFDFNNARGLGRP